MIRLALPSTLTRRSFSSNFEIALESGSKRKLFIIILFIFIVIIFIVIAIPILITIFIIFIIIIIIAIVINIVIVIFIVLLLLVTVTITITIIVIVIIIVIVTNSRWIVVRNPKAKASRLIFCRACMYLFSIYVIIRKLIKLLPLLYAIIGVMGSTKYLTCPSDIPHPITVGKLTIKQLEASDSGIYTCRATNMMGVTEYKAQVTVQRRFLLLLLVVVYEKSRGWAGVTRSENIYQNLFLINVIKITLARKGPLILAPFKFCKTHQYFPFPVNKCTITSLHMDFSNFCSYLQLAMEQK